MTPILVECGDTRIVRCPELPPGNHTLTAECESGTASLVVPVGPLEGLNYSQMIGCIAKALDDALEAGCITSAGVHASLKSKLTAAVESLAGDNRSSAIRQLEAFAKELEAQSGKSVGAGLADALISITFNLVIFGIAQDPEFIDCCHELIRTLGKEEEECRINGDLTDKSRFDAFDLLSHDRGPEDTRASCWSQSSGGSSKASAAVWQIDKTESSTENSGGMKLRQRVQPCTEDCCHGVRASAEMHLVYETILRFDAKAPKTLFSAEESYKANLGSNLRPFKAELHFFTDGCGQPVDVIRFIEIEILVSWDSEEVDDSKFMLKATASGMIIRGLVVNGALVDITPALPSDPRNPRNYVDTVPINVRFKTVFDESAVVEGSDWSGCDVEVIKGNSGGILGVLTACFLLGLDLKDLGK